LVKSKGWVRLANYAKGQLEARAQVIGEPSAGLDSLIQQEFAKGEMGGIGLFMRFPEIIEADYGEQVDELLKEIKANDRENQNDG